MPKRGTKKTSSTSKEKKTSSRTYGKTAGEREIEHAVLKNLIELQKVNINMAEKFDHLGKEISQLLSLFEVTARNFAKNAPPTAEYTKDKDFLTKIDRLLDQNKLLAKGLTMMEERLRERMYGPTPQSGRRERKPEEAGFESSLTSRTRAPPRF
ncbi:MAG: hypothetical protein KJ718_06310 [Nanoarchaeota archaeon]|nr:hypothetical protein [Nanoarchaeota archaeon]MBU1052130.1 hypothetical protein [Nanoarchaeota archaeon]MBU1987864.1 hypothetical protein [Nanoarchaeota archaeon]